MIKSKIKEELLLRAKLYETKDFLQGDPSWFMHQVKGAKNQEVMAFIASALSYGHREQFMKKIFFIFKAAHPDVYSWVKTGEFSLIIPDKEKVSFYRMSSYHDMHLMLKALKDMLFEYDSIGSFVRASAKDGPSAIKAITKYFSSKGVKTLIPKDTNSACKRICMFLRWMVRNDSEVDLGLWNSFIDKRSLIIPMDTHVLKEANRLGLSKAKTASMHSAIALTKELQKVFPEDPLKADFSLFGYGVNK